MAKSIFEKIGCKKKNFISLVNFISNLDIKRNLDKITCKTLILCGVNAASYEVNVDNPKAFANFIYDF